MKGKAYLLLLLVVVLAFWQVSFLQYGIKWDFVDAFLPSRYFFSESILNNQFPLWNPYLLYGTPIYADLVSVFNPEFWIVGNMFGYSNITLQFMFLLYVFTAGVTFFFFLKEFNAEYKLSLGLSVAYMLSGFSIGNAQHLAFVCGYAIVPFVLTSYFKFIRELNKPHLIRVAIALFVMIYASYPGLTIILGYFLLCIFVYYLIVNRTDKSFLKRVFTYHAILVLMVVLSSTVLIIAWFQGSSFLGRYSGLSINLAHRHSFTLKSVLSFLLPMATGKDTSYFETDVSMSNGYWGVISVILFLFALLKKAKSRESYLILFFGVFSFLASLGNQFFLREFLYHYAPLMDMFQYPAIFRAFTIFSLLAFVGINFRVNDLAWRDKKRLIFLAGLVVSFLLLLIFYASSHLEDFVFFSAGKSFTEEVLSATRFDSIVLQGTVQVFILLAFIFITWKFKTIRHYSAALLFLFILDGVVSTQLSTRYTVLSEDNPVAFFKYLRSVPKGFPIPELNPMEENSDRNAQNEFIWMNNNVFPKKITFDGKVAFKLDGYTYLADNHPGLLEAIKKEAVVYFSDDVRENSSVENFTTNTIFLSSSDYKKIEADNLRSNQNDQLVVRNFSPQKIEIKTTTNHPQLLAYQQNYYHGWKVYVDGKEQDLLQSNFAHMAVGVPSGEHTILFEYRNSLIKYAFGFSYLVFFILIAFSIHYVVVQHPERKKKIGIALFSGLVVFLLGSCLNRYFYQKNVKGLIPEIIEKTDDWRKKYGADIRILLSTQQEQLKEQVPADTAFFVDDKTNLSELAHFLVQSESPRLAFVWQGGSVSDDIIELIYSFYPGIIEQKQTSSSGILLLEKNGDKQHYAVSRDFEPGSEEWARDNGRIKTDSVTGNHTYSYDTEDRWGTTVEIPVTEEWNSPAKITVLSDFMFEEKMVETLLVIATDRDGETHSYQVSKIDKFARKPGEWARAAFCIRLDSGLQEGDLIKIYFWNLNKARFQIDNLKVKLSDSE